MMLQLQRQLAAWSAWLMVWAFLCPGTSQAQDHVVPMVELELQLASQAAARARDLADIERALSLPAAREMLDKAQVRTEEIRTSVALLSPGELSRLAQQSRQMERDVQGGALFAILALIGLVVVVIIIVNAVKRNKDSLDF